MTKVKFLLPLLITSLLIGGILYAQPFGLKDSVPEEAIRAVEKYISGLGKCKIEDVDRLGTMTFLFVVKVSNEEVGGENAIHYIITTKYLKYNIIYDGLEKKI